MSKKERVAWKWWWRIEIEVRLIVHEMLDWVKTDKSAKPKTYIRCTSFQSNRLLVDRPVRPEIRPRTIDGRTRLADIAKSDNWIRPIDTRNCFRFDTRSNTLPCCSCILPRCRVLATFCSDIVRSSTNGCTEILMWQELSGKLIEN